MDLAKSWYETHQKINLLGATRQKLDEAQVPATALRRLDVGLQEVASALAETTASLVETLTKAAERLSEGRERLAEASYREKVTTMARLHAESLKFVWDAAGLLKQLKDINAEAAVWRRELAILLLSVPRTLEETKIPGAIGPSGKAGDG